MYHNIARLFYFLKAGSILPIHFLRSGFMVSNIGFNVPVWSTSPGTYSTITSIREGRVFIKLPSGAQLILGAGLYAIIGRNAGTKHNKEYLGKASAICGRRKKITVRSAAKNPIDHPNGGRTRGKQKIKTP